MNKEHNCCGNSHNENQGCCGGHTHENCGCKGHHNNQEEQYITLLLENDEELKCSVLSVFDVEDKEYIALLPIGEEQVLIYQYVEHTEEEFELLNIETEEEFAMVEDVFFDIFNEELFEDEEEYEYDDYDDEEDEE